MTLKKRPNRLASTCRVRGAARLWLIAAQLSWVPAARAAASLGRLPEVCGLQAGRAGPCRGSGSGARAGCQGAACGPRTARRAWRRWQRPSRGPGWRPLSAASLLCKWASLTLTAGRRRVQGSAGVADWQIALWKCAAGPAVAAAGGSAFWLAGMARHHPSPVHPVSPRQPRYTTYRWLSSSVCKKLGRACMHHLWRPAHGPVVWGKAEGWSACGAAQPARGRRAARRGRPGPCQAPPKKWGGRPRRCRAHAGTRGGAFSLGTFCFEFRGDSLASTSASHTCARLVDVTSRQGGAQTWRRPCGARWLRLGSSARQASTGRGALCCGTS